MNRPNKRIYQTELILQSIVYIPMMVSYILFFISPGFGVLGALAQLGVGFVQVFSGAFHSISYQDEFHKKYLMGAISYLAFLFLVVGAINTLKAGIFVFLFIIPICIATWYYYQTWLLHKNADKYESSINGKNISADDDLLDDVIY